MKLEIGNRIENHNGTFAKKVIDSDGDCEFVRASKTEFDQQQSDVNGHMEFLQRSYEVYCLKYKMPVISADELISLIVDIKLALKNHEDDASVAIEVNNQYKSVMGLSKTDCFESCQLVKRPFLMKLEIHQQWLNRYINMHNLINI
jgi:hypothetical protein